MTRAGDKLYGEWDKPATREGLFGSRRFWIGFGVVLAVLLAGAVAMGLMT